MEQFDVMRVKDFRDMVIKYLEDLMTSQQQVGLGRLDCCYPLYLLIKPWMLFLKVMQWDTLENKNRMSFPSWSVCVCVCVAWKTVQQVNTMFHVFSDHQGVGDLYPRGQGYLLKRCQVWWERDRCVHVSAASPVHSQPGGPPSPSPPRARIQVWWGIVTIPKAASQAHLITTYLQVWIRPAFPAFVTMAVVIIIIDYYVEKVLYTVIPIISYRLVFVCLVHLHRWESEIWIDLMWLVVGLGCVLLPPTSALTQLM